MRESKTMVFIMDYLCLGSARIHKELSDNEFFRLLFATVLTHRYLFRKPIDSDKELEKSEPWTS
jgi:hypothetical protein